MDFEQFDTRKYPTIDVPEGYAEWASTYEDTVCDEMDLRLLNRLERVGWSSVAGAVDLACGTGRIGRWLRSRGVERIVGVDCTPRMLERAGGAGTYTRLVEADLVATGLPDGSADLVTAVLVDEHLADLDPLYAEAARLLRPTTTARFVIVGYHPHFLLKGIPTHFDRPTGEAVAIRSYVHLLSDHVKSAHRAGLTLLEMDEGVVDDAWIARKPKWARYRHEPISYAMAWARPVRLPRDER